MARGQPDYGQYAVKEVSASVSDLGEVAARLGSIVTYDKRGDVVDFDNFESPAPRWDLSALDVDGYCRLNSDSPYSGSQSLILFTPNVDSTYALFDRSYPILKSKRIGIEISFCHLDADQFLTLSALRYDGVNWLQSKFKYSRGDNKLYVLTTGGVYYEVAVIPELSVLENMYHTIKLVADFDTGLYVRVMLNEKEYDISTVSLNSGALGVAARFLIEGIMQNEDGAGGYCYCDNFVLTQAEP